uniref:Uncharacterized protein n=1 Tax=Vespula pensylvanica TaxID=30213 RepID=A0A834NYU0_VESPE|nr:hypothetical protein H0235_009422 [Vespula pensylvanica]
MMPKMMMMIKEEGRPRRCAHFEPVTHNSIIAASDSYVEFTWVSASDQHQPMARCIHPVESERATQTLLLSTLSFS